MFDLSTIRSTWKYLVQTYGPLFPATATTVAAIVAAFAARAAMRSAKASEENVETGKKSMEIANRAYITMTSARLVEVLQLNKTTRVRAAFKNVGRTPAMKMTMISELYILADMNTALPQLPEPNGIFSFAPNQEITVDINSDFLITQDDIAALTNNTKFLFYWGEITYQDVFHHQHKTTWCLRYDSQASSGLRMHSSGNEII